MFPPIIVLMIIFNGSNISDESTSASRRVPVDKILTEAVAGPVLCGNQPVMAWKAIEQTSSRRRTGAPEGFPRVSAGALEGLAVNEFEGFEFKPFTQIGRPSLKTGADALARLSFEDSTIRRTAVAQGAILGACYLQTYRVLKNARPRYATLKRATVVDDGIRWTADARRGSRKFPGSSEDASRAPRIKHAREKTGSRRSPTMRLWLAEAT